jgi:hypothetical protein
MDDLSYLRAGEACHAGKFLNKKEVELLEQSLQTEPENLNDRLKLIGFYYKTVQWDSSSRKAALKHISWLVANKPDHIALLLPETTTAFVSDSSLDEELSSQWETVISHRKSNPTILRYAAAFLRFHRKARAEELLRLAESLEIKDKSW